MNSKISKKTWKIESHPKYFESNMFNVLFLKKTKIDSMFVKLQFSTKALLPFKASNAKKIGPYKFCFIAEVVIQKENNSDQRAQKMYDKIKKAISVFFKFH